MRNKASITIGLLLILCLNSCIENINPSWQTNNTIPVITASLGLNDIMADSNLYLDSNMQLHYTDFVEIYEMQVDSLLNTLDTVEYFTYKMPFSVNAVPGQNIIDVSKEKIFDFDHIDLNEIKLKSGKLSIKIFSTLSEKVICEYSIFSATKDGNHVYIRELVDEGSSATTYSSTFDLSGYTINMLSDDGLRSNTMSTQQRITLADDANPISITPLDSFSIYLYFEDLVFEHIKGNVKKLETSFENQEVSIDFTNIYQSGSIEIGDIIGNLVVSNGLGLDLQIKPNYIRASNQTQSFDLNTSWMGSAININRSTYVGGNDTITPSILYKEINASDNFNDFITLLPNKITYDFDVKLNPIPNISGGNDFVYTAFPLKVGLDINALLNLNANNLSLADTITAWDNTSMPDELGDIRLKVIIDNGFPIGTDLSIAFLDNFNQLIENFIIDEHIIAAATDANFFPVGMNRTIVYIDIPHDRAARILESENIALKAVFDTDDKSINITKDSKLDISIIANFDYTIQL